MGLTFLKCAHGPMGMVHIKNSKFYQDEDIMYVDILTIVRTIVSNALHVFYNCCKSNVCIQMLCQTGSYT